MTDTQTRPRFTLNEVDDDRDIEAHDEIVIDAAGPVEPVTDDGIPAATKALLDKAGLDHVPTVDEAKALLDARKDEIRTEVLRQADMRDWCEDGTRKVCANLRLPRPGERQTHKVQVEMTLTLTLDSTAYTAEGALARMRRGGQLSETWLRGHLYGEVNKLELLAATCDGEPVDVAQLKREQPEVTR